MLSSVVLLAVSAVSVLGQAPTPTQAPARIPVPNPTAPLPLTQYLYTYPNLPEQVFPFSSGRGPQNGYNVCNSTTAGDNSLCQTLIMNSIDDFCLWGSATKNSTIGDSEAETIAFCSKDTHGARLIPAGAIKAVQFMRTEAYIQIVGKIDQTKLNLRSDDYGGELDPHGADLAGNPLGGLVYSNGFGADNTSYTQVISWNNFVGSNLFCLKICNPSYNSGSTNYCQNVYDLIGCDYNMPSSLYNSDANTFESCEGGLQDEVGTYTGANGATSTWIQPQPTVPVDYVMPWNPRIPASSNCKTFQSTAIYAVATAAPISLSALPVGSGSSGASAATGTGTTQSGSTGIKTGANSPVATGAKVNSAGVISISIFTLVALASTLII